MKQRTRAIAIAAALAVVAIAAPIPVPSAGADPVDACPERTLEPTFAPLLDPIPYFPMPGGGFEPGAGQWQLRGGARVVAGANQTLLELDGAGADDHALLLPAGGVARSESICVEGAATVMRFFARSTGLLGLLTVTVTATDDQGDRQTLVSPVLAPLPLWSAPIALFRLPLLGDHLTDVTVEIRSVGLSPVLVDDVHIDPLRQR